MNNSKSLPTLRRNNSTGVAIRGSLALAPRPTRRRPKRTGATVKAKQPVPPLEIIIRQPRLPRLKVPKKETRNVELRWVAKGVGMCVEKCHLLKVSKALINPLPPLPSPPSTPPEVKPVSSKS
jgi:hypothetical protein